MAALRVLLADDDPAMRDWMARVVRRRTSRIRAAGSGWEVLWLLADEPFDVVVTDVRMGAPNGIQALASARTAGVTVPFVLVTAFADDQLRANARALDAIVLDKPFDADDLLAAIAAVVPAPARAEVA